MQPLGDTPIWFNMAIADEDSEFACLELFAIQYAVNSVAVVVPQPAKPETKTANGRALRRRAAIRHSGCYNDGGALAPLNPNRVLAAEGSGYRIAGATAAPTSVVPRGCRPYCKKGPGRRSRQIRWQMTAAILLCLRVSADLTASDPISHRTAE